MATADICVQVCTSEILDGGVAVAGRSMQHTGLPLGSIARVPAKHCHTRQVEMRAVVASLPVAPPPFSIIAMTRACSSSAAT